MTAYRRSILLASLAGLLLVHVGAQEQGVRSPAGLTDDEKAHFLLNAKIVRTRRTSEGITNSVRATLSLGALTHQAQVQDVDIYKMSFPTARGTELNFRDRYQYNIAAYKLSRMLGLDTIPVSVERKVAGTNSAVTWWIDDVLMTEKTRYFRGTEPPDSDIWNQQIYRVRVFDELIYNTDRNLGNLVITNDWKLWMIDHTRAFRLQKKVGNRKQLVKCDRKLLEAMRNLDSEDVSRELKSCLSNSAIKALLARRDEIVSYFDQQAATRGESAVLYDYSGP